MRTQDYLPNTWFELPAPAIAPTAPAIPDHPPQRSPPTPGMPPRAARGASRWSLWLGGMVLLVVVLAIAGASNGAWSPPTRACATSARENLNWTAARLVLSNFTETRKSVKPDPARSGVLPGVAPQTDRQRHAKLDGARRLARDRIRIPLARQDPEPTESVELNEYERLFFDALAGDGELSQSELKQLKNTAIANIQTPGDAEMSPPPSISRGIESIRPWAKQEKPPRTCGAPTTPGTGGYHNRHPFPPALPTLAGSRSLPPWIRHPRLRGSPDPRARSPPGAELERLP